MESEVLISVVSPVYQAEGMLDELVERIIAAVAPITDRFEVVLVDDRSRDNSWQKLKQLAASDSRVKAIRLSRNFGQHYAITAGLDAAHGQWVVVIDCDLQDRPEEIPRLFDKASEGFEIVQARRTNRRDPFLKRFFSRLFYRSLAYLSGTTHDETIANFGIYHRKVIVQVNQLRESIRFFPTMIRWVGFRSATVDVEHAQRAEGKSQYNFRKLMMLALDIILAYSDRPLRLVIKLGMVIAIFSLVFILITAYKWYAGDIQVLGYPSLIISIWLLSGCLMTTLGVVGLYVGKTFEGIKNRPIYIVDETV